MHICCNERTISVGSLLSSSSPPAESVRSDEMQVMCEAFTLLITPSNRVVREVVRVCAACRYRKASSQLLVAVKITSSFNVTSHQ